MTVTPKHVAIIMDGNGRWAQARCLPRVAGHEAGAKRVREVVESCVEHKIDVLTLFAFGIDNWKRPVDEVNFLMGLFYEMLVQQTPEMHKNNIRIRVIGDYSKFSDELTAKIIESQQQTANNTGLTLVLAVNYSGQWDIMQAVQKVVSMSREPDFDASQLTESQFSRYLVSADLPDPDLFIRTSGEQRISNFYLWQLAYTELLFTDEHWPDFSNQSFEQALQFYATRLRRFGCTSEQVSTC